MGSTRGGLFIEETCEVTLASDFHEFVTGELDFIVWLTELTGEVPRVEQRKSNSLQLDLGLQWYRTVCCVTVAHSGQYLQVLDV